MNTTNSITVENYYNYTREDHEVWALLMNESDFLLSRASKEFLEGAKRIEFSKTRIPSLNEINEVLFNVTGWKYQPIKGTVSNLEFFEALSDRIFLSSVEIRPLEELNFCKLPDVFHDVFGHAALLTNQPFTEFLEELGSICVNSKQENIISAMSRIYWYTAEVGLVRQDGKIRYYGGSIISSVAEIENVFDKPTTKILPYNIDSIFDTPYDSYNVNSQYFVVDSMAQLNDSIPELKEKIMSLTSQ